ncbi:MAG: hypothetical protein HZA15_15555 [Nitrospirae bacterium]|nr:hypothetical protein [Nitrospirota bacterium]
MRHAAQIETSERLQKVLEVLQDRQWHGTFDIMMQTSLCAVGSAISELRANGIEVECRCAGKGRYEYRLNSERLFV